MKITKISKTGSKYKLVLDSGEIITTYDDVILNNNLLFSKRIDKKLLEKIYSDNNYYQIYNKVLKLINTRLRSEYEIEEYLTKTEITAQDKQKMLENLKEIGLINDRNFAKAYTNDKINLSLDGPEKIVKNLKHMHIQDDYINEAISNIDEEIVKSHIDKIITKKAKANTKDTITMLKQKILNYLVNQGYSKEQAMLNLESYSFPKKDLTDEMEKIYQKQIKKKDKNFKQKLKAKLYSKGFTIEEINRFIESKSIWRSKKWNLIYVY